ncbi:peptidoglycan DD-metalloendopeptidase family protein [Aquisalinus flavus]|nr:peptidoglycan DD-metalloendopeptidase family protein [Aquisalinus flavus]MBD0427281.1 peptidoglycan DD-metalloendopeptidase family protein [Aquisalinus flavus]UNE47092.1 peptidoglycan DD-metalloendopeptidase family protein [Aquisalinus flavus]
MRVKLLLMTGAACLIPVGLGADDSANQTTEKQKAPVVFATDPGDAHPRNVEADLAGVGASGNADAGAFDYGAGDGIDTMLIATATGGPTPLRAEFSQDSTQTGVLAGGLYGQDPIYRMAQASQAEASQAEATQLAYAKDKQAEGYITVQPGDTVFALSRRYGAKPAAIIEANDLSAPYALDIGQELLIPGLADAAPATIATYTEESEAQEEAPVRPVTVSLQTETQEETTQAELMAEQPAAQPAAQPVRSIDAAYAEQAMGMTTHMVEPGNTLFSIAKSYGLDVSAVAEANNIEAPYALSIGQELVIPSTAAGATASLSSRPAPSAETQEMASRAINPIYEPEQIAEADAANEQTEASYSLPKSSEKSRFEWPLQGRVIMSYGMSDDGRRNDGINIAAPVGTPIRSVDDGEVVYRGSELEGYGNLLLIKHTDGWVSAYAHTDAILVNKGDKIRKGQIIAKVGTTGSVDQPQLHFELRHELKPTDPIAALDGSDAKAVKF